MLRPFRRGFGFMMTATVLAGCSTAPTITVPNPLAAFNGALALPQIASAPAYTTLPAGSGYYQPAPASYANITPSYTSAAPVNYGSTLPGYTTSAVPSYASAVPTTTTYSAAPSVYAPAPQTYSMAAPAVSTGSYSLGNVSTTQTAYTSSIPTLSPVQASAPTYSLGTPAVNTGTYSLGSVATPTYSASVPTFGTVQPVQASGTTYDLTAPSTTNLIDPAAGLAVDTAYSTLNSTIAQSGAVPSMGGAFQVIPTTPTSLGGGIATYNAAQPTLGLPTFGY